MELQALSPILRVADLLETVRFYENVLGFKSRSEFPNFATVSRDNVEIMMMGLIVEPGDQSSLSKPLFTGTFYIFTKSVDELWESFKNKVTVKTTIADRQYLMRDFSILDNNGYELVFGEDISKR